MLSLRVTVTVLTLLAAAHWSRRLLAPLRHRVLRDMIFTENLDSLAVPDALGDDPLARASIGGTGGDEESTTIGAPARRRKRLPMLAGLEMDAEAAALGDLLGGGSGGSGAGGSLVDTADTAALLAPVSLLGGGSGEGSGALDTGTNLKFASSIA